MVTRTALTVAVTLCVTLLSLSDVTAQTTSRTTPRTPSRTPSRTSTTTTTEETPLEEELPEEDLYLPFQGERFEAFDWRLCKILNAKETGNVVVSPIGVKIVLAMLYEGSLGSTASEIRNTLHLPSSRDAVRKRFSGILSSLKETQGEYILDIGTKVYVDVSVTPREKFAKILKEYYNSCIEQLDFSKSAEAANKINSWVEAITHGAIQNMVTEADSMSSKVMLLLNAIYFKGLWRHPFNPEVTRNGRFHVTNQKAVTAKYMKNTDKFYIYESPVFNAKILRLPYMGKKYSMFVVLPNDPNGLDQLLKAITPEELRHHMFLMEEGRVEVILPKFSFKFTADLSDVLKEMGIIELFSDRAQLHGVVKGGRLPAQLYVSDVLQKAGLEVDEHGTTAYGVTEVSVVNKLGEEDYVFNATHPFMFYIEDEVAGTVIFVGRVIDPSQMDTIPDRFQPIPTHSETPSPTPAPRPSTGATPARRPGGTRPTRPTPTPEPRRRFTDSDDAVAAASGTRRTPPPTPPPGSSLGSRMQRPETVDVAAAARPKPESTVSEVWSQLYANRQNSP